MKKISEIISVMWYFVSERQPVTKSVTSCSSLHRSKSESNFTSNLGDVRNFILHQTSSLLLSSLNEFN